MFFVICAWTNGWVNNREAGDLRHHRAHYDVSVMFSINGHLYVTINFVKQDELPSSGKITLAEMIRRGE